MNHEHIIRDYFSKLGLEPEIAAIYIALHTHGAQTLSELSRNAGVERTRIYRLLDRLTESNLIEVEAEYKRNLYRAAPITNLRLLISRKDQELRSLQTELDAIEQLLAPATLSSPATRVQFYRGAEGNKQMFWNETKARTEIVALLYENMQIKTNSAFFERWVQRCNERGIHFRGIISDEFIASQRTWYANRSNERLAHWEARYVPNAAFPLTHSLIVYDDVTAFYNWKDQEIFGVEIHNQQIAQTHRQFFGMLWNQATPVDDTAA